VPRRQHDVPPFEGGISQRLDHTFTRRRRALISVKRRWEIPFDSYSCCEGGLLVNVRRVAEIFLCRMTKPSLAGVNHHSTHLMSFNRGEKHPYYYYITTSLSLSE
jgi:hypothetical protein